MVLDLKELERKNRSSRLPILQKYRRTRYQTCRRRSPAEKVAALKRSHRLEAAGVGCLEDLRPKGGLVRPQCTHSLHGACCRLAH